MVNEVSMHKGRIYMELHIIKAPTNKIILVNSYE